MKNICIFLSGHEPEAKYKEPAEECSKMLAKSGFDLVWGGTDVGMMKTVSDIFQENGRRLIGVTTERLKSRAKESADEMIVTKDMLDRKRTMIEKSDAFVIFVGGIGTLDEIGEVLELQKSGIMNKPIAVLNSEGFFDGLKMQLEIMELVGLLPKPLSEIVYFANIPEEVSEYLKSFSL
ncbi:TIGR00730 family Rossman fold protein [Candidatus Campbellbacteria bacterium CG22_combo_CG10-13_8_21_14_all_36_13]|uniref:Cytokinin riboside 5'-monophosphate phosphoribohydrolase n=1 Tax=Candidatus Campbellbacteria bacterium CG22_combo_CG10-13_8_21_14_all_36_13 TaxID=1974529 RepID=A0A2H0DYV4_9BACT|nr:MAG: TIGR00730 family Rossman fold protein [Candidatus Campbellbacteria bacterium CG22_combo_CG10-13_8_21_14_all_36_13]